MMNIVEQDYLLQTLKALADKSRLTIIQWLHEREYTVGELAEVVQLSEPTVSHHLAQLREVGLVTLRMAGTQRFYRLNEPGLATFKAKIATLEQRPPQPEPVVVDNRWIEALSWDEADKQVLRDYTANGKIIRWPAKQKKLMVLVRWLATLFEAKRLYTEPEINAVLKAVYAEDYVTLRRELVDGGYLRRERGGGKYWVTPEDETLHSH